MSKVSASASSIGFMTMGFVIQEVTGGFAYGVDSFNRNQKVPIGVIPTKGPQPMPGEKWLISKAQNGIWTLVGIINNPEPPVITGALNDGTALRCLLSYLDAIGYIDNQTTPTSRAASDSLPAVDTISAT